MRRSQEEWLEIIGKQQASGLKVGAFCLREGIAANTFYAQRAKLAGPSERERGCRGAVEFVELGVEKKGIWLELGGGPVLFFGSDVSAGKVADIVRALRGCG